MVPPDTPPTLGSTVYHIIEGIRGSKYIMQTQIFQRIDEVRRGMDLIGHAQVEDPLC
jgi:hypothetical protein